MAATAARKLKLLSSMAPRKILLAAIDLYQVRGATGVDAEAAGGVEVAHRVASGEKVDLVVLASEAIDELIDGGHLLATGRVDAMRSGIAVAVMAGACHPNIIDESSVREAIINAATICYSTGPSGKYLKALFERWGILDELRPRILIPEPGTPVAKLVADGQAKLGFQQRSELLCAPGIEVVGPLPAPIQYLTTFTGGISRTCTNLAVARSFLTFLTSSQTHELMHRHGMSPIGN